MGAAVLALVIANSPLSGFYFETLHRRSCILLAVAAMAGRRVDTMTRLGRPETEATVPA